MQLMIILELLAKKEKLNPVGMLVITSNKGLVGAYNANRGEGYH